MKPLVAAIAAASLFAGCAVFAPAPATPTNDRIDKLFAQWNNPDSPGCSVGVSRNGRLEYQRAYGMANLELNVPLTPESSMEAASISKQFTAMSIMLLAERGQLGLEDDVRKYLPEIPDYGSALTIRHLLNHTSGLRDAFLIFELSPPEDEYSDRNDIIVRQLARQRSLNYTPGSETQYNNGGYILLARIVRRVSGQTLGAFADANIFKPLGMTGTRFRDDPSVLLPNRASNYVRDGEAWRLVHTNAQPGAVGNSGLWTTPRDLLRWADNLGNPKVGSASLFNEMQKPSGVPSVDNVQWGLGFDINTHRDTTVVGHGGGDRGIDNYFAWYPQQRLAIAVLCNTDNTGSILITRQIADLFLVRPRASASGATATPAQATIKLPIDQLESKAGLYREVGGYAFFRTFVRDDVLRGALGAGTGDSFPLAPQSESGFIIPGTPFAVEFAPAGTARATSMRSFDGHTQTGTFERVEPFAPSAAQLRAYAGQYASDELNVVWTIDVHDSTLVIRRPGNADTIIEPLATDMFTTVGDFMRFTRDPRGAITGFTLVASGARGLPFERKR